VGWEAFDAGRVTPYPYPRTFSVIAADFVQGRQSLPIHQEEENGRTVEDMLSGWGPSSKVPSSAPFDRDGRLEAERTDFVHGFPPQECMYAEIVLIY